MPLYDFECKKCSHNYEELVPSYDKSGEYPDVVCPECGSKKKIKLVGAPAAAIFKNPEGCDKWCNSHDYRAKYKMEQGAIDRQFAETHSHVGSNPYKNDPTSGDHDVQSGKYFGKVK